MFDTENDRIDYNKINNSNSNTSDFFSENNNTQISSEYNNINPIFNLLMNENYTSFFYSDGITRIETNEFNNSFNSSDH